MDVVPAMPRSRSLVFALMYLSFAFIGVNQLASPSTYVATEAGAWFYLWAAMLALGGGASAVGAAGRWWIAELVGQPLIAAPFAVWAQVVWAAGTPSRYAFGALCVAVVAGCVIRGMDVLWLAQRDQELR